MVTGGHGKGGGNGRGGHGGMMGLGLGALPQKEGSRWA